MTDQTILHFTKNATIGNGLGIETVTLLQVQQVFRAINHQLRQRMLNCLSKEGRLTVSGIYRYLGIEQVVCSQQLSVLRKAGLVHSEREGKKVYYRINVPRLQALHDMAYQLIAMVEG